MGANNSTNGTDINISELMVINAANVDSAVGFEQDANITPGDTSICTTVNQGHTVGCFGCGCTISDMCHVDGPCGGF